MRKRERRYHGEVVHDRKRRKRAILEAEQKRGIAMVNSARLAVQCMMSAIQLQSEMITRTNTPNYPSGSI